MSNTTKPDVEAFEAFLCRAWGESDLPSAELVIGWDGVRRFMVREWLGAEDATDYDGTVTLDRLKADFDEHEEDQRGSVYEIEFEIGGVSIERVVGFRPAREPACWIDGSDLDQLAKLGMGGVLGWPDDGNDPRRVPVYR
jgi:hypothetical protein